jgi:ankyrin repeat protein
MALDKFPLHEAAAAGNTERLSELLRKPDASAEIERLDLHGETALMRAARSNSAGPEILQKLLDAGAALFRKSSHPIGLSSTALTLALQNGDPTKVAVLVRAGADLGSSILDAVHGRDVPRDPRLLDLLKYCIDQGADLDYQSEYNETALRVLSRLGRFDAVKLLLEAGADEGQLAWNPLLRAIAFSEHAEMERQLDAGADPEARDYWGRTAWLLAISAANLAAAKRLFECGVASDAVGRRGKPALFFAIETYSLPMLEWLLSLGVDPGATDESGESALSFACEYDFPEGVELLIAAGADVNVSTGIYTPLQSARSTRIAQRLLQAGADPAELNRESTRLFVGLPPDAAVELLDVTAEEFRRGAARRFGRGNPEEIDEPFWIAMIRSGVNAWRATETFNEVRVESPVWCADRFGQSMTFLPDGRIVQIAGEHEDSYDPDFCIYNDVFVHDGGATRIYGYPEEVFPPTDFHSATLVGRKIFLIGSLGYSGKRAFGTTPVYTLDTETLAIERLHPTGPPPGWIYKHRAELQPTGEIVISGGTVAIQSDGEERQIENAQRYAFDSKTFVWRRLISL